MQTSRGLSPVEVENFYDRLGMRQDKQNYYEEVALADLIHHANFENAKSIVEFGCGTGRFAEELLGSHLPDDAIYWGCDVSSTMIELGRKRLSSFSERVVLWKSMGDVALPLKDNFADGFVSNYVLDILSIEEIRSLINEAHRILKPNGLFCLTGLTYGKGLISKIWTAFWKLRFDLNPKWVGGCRPVALTEFLDEWNIVHHNVVVARGISSEVVVVKKR